MPRILSYIKQIVVPARRKPRRIVRGLYKGLTLDVDLRQKTQLYVGLDEAETMGWIRKLSQGVKSVIDIGAAEGELSIYLLLKTNAEKVYAIDPGTGTRDTLYHNLAMNGVQENPRLQVLHKFVGTGKEENFVALDFFIPDIAFPCFIKIDVDGGEVDILNSAPHLLANEDTRWLIETHSKELEEQCIRIFQAHNYEYRIIPNARWRLFLPEMRPIPHNRWMVAYHPPV